MNRNKYKYVVLCVKRVLGKSSCVSKISHSWSKKLKTRRITVFLFRCTFELTALLLRNFQIQLHCCTLLNAPCLWSLSSRAFASMCKRREPKLMSLSHLTSKVAEALGVCVCVVLCVCVCVCVVCVGMYVRVGVGVRVCCTCTSWYLSLAWLLQWLKPWECVCVLCVCVCMRACVTVFMYEWGM